MDFRTYLILKAFFNPSLIVIYFIRKLPYRFFFRLRMAFDGVNRPYYAYGLLQAANEAKSLGIKKISAIEFGVAAGNGLLELEKLSEHITRITGVKINVYGFDLATGLPQPADYRDLPFIWQKGFYVMDIKALKDKLKPTTKLYLGNVKATTGKFIQEDIAPIGFISFDLDYYTSTRDAFVILKAANQKILPRVFCYFDDIIGTDEEILSDYVGELLAIREFNQKNKKRKIAPLKGLFHKRVIQATWTDMIYVLHVFDHKLYNKYIYHKKDRQSSIANHS
jgi:hypothetical protein